MRSGLGGLVIQRRRELGLTQQELARRIGVPTANLSQLEHSTSRWQSRLLWALADELRLPQLELALAAGVITDLPRLDNGPVEPTGTIDDLVIAYLNGTSDGPVEEARPRLARLVEQLDAEDAEFLAAVARQLIERRQPLTPASDASDRELVAGRS
jgi:transcriptional regulator with XRE-family HTH domain